jgi:hypothetical protein
MSAKTKRKGRYYTELCYANKCLFDERVILGHKQNIMLN